MSAPSEESLLAAPTRRIERPPAFAGRTVQVLDDDPAATSHLEGGPRPGGDCLEAASAQAMGGGVPVILTVCIGVSGFPAAERTVPKRFSAPLTTRSIGPRPRFTTASSPPEEDG